MRPFVQLTAALLIIASAAPSLAAQEPGPRSFPRGSSTAATSRDTCTYDTCALRVEFNFWGPRLVSGKDGSEVARLGWLGGHELERVLARSDSATAYVEPYVRSERASRLLNIAGAVAFGVGVAESGSLDGLALGGVALTLIAIPFELKAQRQLSRAVWWYNSTLPNTATGGAAIEPGGGGTAEPNAAPDAAAVEPRGADRHSHRWACPTRVRLAP